MLIRTLLILVIFCPLNSLCQNLVPNSSFEEVIDPPCGWTVEQNFNNHFNDWFVPTGGSTDIFSTFVDISCFANCFSTNADAVGHQPPKTGEVMSAIVTYGNGAGASPGNYREYIEIQLTNPLDIGQTYYAEMYVSLCDYVNKASNNIGMVFSESVISDFGTEVLSYVPQINELSIISDTTNWVLISGQFIANAAYEYVTIGNFYESSLTDIIIGVNGSVATSSNARYFVDDITVRKACENTLDTLSVCLGDTLILSSEINDFVGWALSSNPSEIFSTEEILNITPAENTTYFGYTVCDTATIHVQVNPTANFTLGSDTFLCPGDTLFLSAPQTAASFSWNDGSQESTLEITEGDTYWIEVQDNCGIYVDSIEISLLSPLSIDFGEDLTLCYDDSLLLSANAPNATYLWQDGSLESSYWVFEEGIYSVAVNDNCTSDNDEIEISFFPEIPLDFPEQIIKCISDSLLLSLNITNANYLWQDGSTEQNYLVTEAGLYQVEVTQNGCLKSDSVLVEEDACEIILDMPNVFSPNGDEINDHFRPIDLSGLDFGNMKIFNRWGNLVFQTQHLATGWDGSCGASSCVDGTYFWTINYQDINGNTINLKGDLTLME